MGAYLASDLVNTLPPNIMGLSMPSTSCPITKPSPFSDASVCKMKCLLKSRKINKSGLDKCCFIYSIAS